MMLPSDPRSPPSRGRDLETEIRDAKILLADDDPSVRRALLAMLGRAGYGTVREATNGAEALVLTRTWAPDLVILDLHMPETDGFEVLDLIARSGAEQIPRPVLVLTGDRDVEAKNRAFHGGAHDFLVKPPEVTESLARVHNLLATRVLHRRLAHQNQGLECQVRERTEDLENAHLELLDRLATVAEYRDEFTGAHQQRVGLLAELLSERLGLDGEQCRLIRRAAPLHDIGKVAIPDAILLKPGPLTDSERDIMCTHTTIGARMLRNGKFELLQLAELIALTHHERWDGTGYPGALRGERIPMAGRLAATADVFDCMTRARPYKGALPAVDAVVEIGRCAGSQFDPDVVGVLEELWDEGALTSLDSLSPPPGREGH